MSLPFLKMNGAGNDFVIIPAVHGDFNPSARDARRIADRERGIGCDQLIALDHSDCAHARMRIWNADGGQVEACGNATRCVGWLLMKAANSDKVLIETASGVREARRSAGHVVTVDMGEPRLDWREIPLAWNVETRDVPMQFDPRLRNPGCVNMGNPHVVFFVETASLTAVEKIGPLVERHWMFPERVNVGFAEVVSPERIRLRVWERGVGQTLACGTGACAALVAAHRRNLCGRSAEIEMDGGVLSVQWRAGDNHIWLSGPVVMESSGRLPDWRDGSEI